MPVMRQLDIVQPVEGGEKPRPRTDARAKRRLCELGLGERWRSRYGVCGALGGRRREYRAYFADSPG